MKRKITDTIIMASTMTIKVLILLFLTIDITLANNGKAQVKSVKEVNVSLHAESSKLKTVFKEIEDKTEFRFNFSNCKVDLSKKVSLQFRDASVEAILLRISRDFDLKFRQVNNNIGVHNSTKEHLVNEEIPVFILQKFTIKGKVLDSNGEALPGATIIERGTSNGTVTDVEGYYSLMVEEGAILDVSFVGYQTKEINVGTEATINIQLMQDSEQLDEVVVIGYGSVKKSDLTGSVASVKGEDLKYMSITQVSDMFAGTVAGLNASQGTSAAGGSSLEVRGPTSLNASNEPLIVLDGVIFRGSLREINAQDIESIDILKDASSAAVFGSKAASGVILITTTKGRESKPTINFSARIGITESYNKRKGIVDGNEYIKFRQDYFRQINPDIYNTGFYANPDDLPDGLTVDDWRSLGTSPLADNTAEWLARLAFYDVEQKNYLVGKTVDWYNQVFRTGLRQEYDISISGGTDQITYYWSIGLNDFEGMMVGDEYAAVRSRLNLDFKVTEWLNVGLNSQFSNQDNGSQGISSFNIYSISPYGEVFDDNDNLRRMPHGYRDNPLLNYYRDSKLDKSFSLFSNLYGKVSLPFGIAYKISFQPYYRASKDFQFTTISEKLGGLSGEIPTGRRNESTTMNWMIDNLLTWQKSFGIHNFDITLLANLEENRYWSSSMTNQNFLPSQLLGYHGLQYGDSPGISNNDTRSTGDALMARINYGLMEKYLFTGSVRRDGYSAFGIEHPRANFSALAFAWVLSNENFFKSEMINNLKLRFSWGVNGNRDIGIYSALAQSGSDLWHDGMNTRVGVYNSTLANSGLRWERTESFNIGMDVSFFDNKVNLTADIYDMTTTDLLMERLLPEVTGFSSITSNLGELGNRGLDLTLKTTNVVKSNFIWNSSIVFSLNRNKIKTLFGDRGTYTLLGEERTGDVPDFTNGWFPGQAIDVIWDYENTGIWQSNETESAAIYNLQPGDYKVVDLNNDSAYVDVDDKQFIGYRKPRFRFGFRNDFNFLKNFTASIFVRGDLGQMAAYPDALHTGWNEFYKHNRAEGPMPYWTIDNPSDEYPRLNPYLGAFGGGIMIYKPASFVRVQDLMLTYNVPGSSSLMDKLNLKNLELFGSVRNLATFSKWPGWDPESGMNPMPRTYTIGLNVSL